MRNNTHHLKQAFGCLLILALVPAFILEAQGAGKKRKKPNTGTVSQISQPTYNMPSPVRRVVLKDIGTKPFQLPNGSMIDLSADLNTMLNTSVTGTAVFSPADPGFEDPCGTWIEIRSAVSTLELNVLEMGISFGYSPEGSIDQVVTDLDGSLDVRIGTIAMDFHIYECVEGRGCQSRGASTASQQTTGVDLSVEIDFNDVTTGPHLIYNTPLGSALRKIMVNGMKELANSARLHELTWRASVREVNLDVGSIWFDAGTKDRLRPNERFEVYAVPSDGVCRVYKRIALVHTEDVNTVSSYAIIDQIMDGATVEEGDVVMIRQLPYPD